MAAQSCQADGEETELMNYYINGIWKNDDGDDAQTSFLSAKQSCVAFENALISERNNVYATFKDQITNYLDDELAKLIRKEAKDQTSIAQAFNTLKQTDTQNQIDSMQAQNQLAQLKADAAIASAESLAQLQEANKQLVELFKDKLQSKCTIVADSYIANGQKDKKGLVEIFNGLLDVKVCLNTTSGEVTAIESATDDTSNNSTNDSDNDSKGNSICGGTILSCLDDVGLDRNTLVSKLADGRKYTEKFENLASTGKLEAGLYRIELSGGGGGGGAARHNSGDSGKGGNGGAGELKESIFFLSGPSDYKFDMGKGGAGGQAKPGGQNGGSGGTGGTSTFEIKGVISLSALGGGGGEGGKGGFSNTTSGTPGGGRGGGASGGEGNWKSSQLFNTMNDRYGSPGKNGYVILYKYE